MMESGESAKQGKPEYFVQISIAVVLVTGLILRITYLGSDPYYDIWSGYITDEGRWSEQARNIILFGIVNTDDWLSLIHLVLSPLFQALTAVSFSLFGVSFTSARLLSAICGVVLLIASFIFLRRRFTSDALFLSMLVLATQPDLLFLSRVAIPEVPAMLFEFLAFAVLISAPHTIMKAAVAGLLTAAALGMKATVAPIVGIFLVILIYTQHVNVSSSLLMRATAYLAALIAPAVIILCAAVFLGGGEFVDQLWGSLQGLERFVQHASLYSLLSFLFYGDVALALNVLLTGAWIMAGLFIAVGRLPVTAATTIYAASAIWIAGWLAVSAGLTYFPPRYVFHILVPLILHLGAGLTLLQKGGWQKIPDALLRLVGIRRFVVFLWLSLPIAALLCPVTIAITDMAGFSIDRFREQLPLLLILTVALSFVLGTIRRRPAIFSMLVFPLLAVLLWYSGVQIRIIRFDFWDAAGSEALLAWLILLAVAATVAVLLGRICNQPVVIRRFGYFYLVAFAAIWLWETSPGIINPTYTIANISAELENYGGTDTTFGTGAAASLFLNNRLRYTEMIHREHLPDMLVVAFNKINPEILKQYKMIRQQDLELGYEKNNETSRELSIRIYQLKQ